MASARVIILVHLALLAAGVNPACPKSTTNNKSNSRTQRSVSSQRLPRSVRPMHYDLELQVFNKNDTFKGQVTIWLQIFSSTSNLTLHSVNLSLTDSRLVSHDPLVPLPRVKRVYDEKLLEQLVVELDQKLTAGSEVGLLFKFNGKFHNDQQGIYKLSYKGTNNTEKNLVMTQMEATFARRVFPCFDEPEMKATFNITVVREKSQNSIANTRRLVSIDRDGDWMADQYEPTVVMSTYLLAIFVCDDYQFIEDSETSDEVVRIWSAEHLLEQTNYSASIAPRLLNFYEDFFNVSYPLPKMDLVSVPDFLFGAMENYGLLIFQEESLLFNFMHSSAKYKQDLALLVAHEISHQWFGNLVTMKWWNDLWLKEGTANYFMFLGIDNVEPAWNVMDQLFMTVNGIDVMILDSWNSTHLISNPIEISSEIGGQYDKISYSKGAALIRMIDHFLTREIFQLGIQTFLQAHKYGVATQKDFWFHLNQAAKNCSDLNETDVTLILESWTLQRGYPVVILTRDYNQQKATVIQMRFSINQQIQTDRTKWWIPITFTTATERNFEDTFPKKWLKSNNESIVLNETDGLPSAEAWVLVNLQRIGFFRVNYDSYNWNLLIQQLKSDHKKIHVSNRAQIVDDILNLARAGYQNYHLALSATKYLAHENQYLPWAVAMKALDYIDAMLKFSNKYTQWKRYMERLVKPLYTNLTYFEYEDDDQLKKLTRSEIIKIACYYEVSDCVENALKMFKLWMKSNGSAVVAANVIETTVCVSVGRGGTAEWEFAWQELQKSNYFSEKKSILLGLACTREPALLLRLLQSSLTSSLSSQVTSDVISQIGKVNSLAPFVAAQFIRDQWKTVKTMYPFAMTIEPIIGALTSTMNTQEDLKHLKSFIAEDGDNGSASGPYAVAVETVKANILWMKTNMDAIGMWLDKNS